MVIFCCLERLPFSNSTRRKLEQTNLRGFSWEENPSTQKRGNGVDFFKAAMLGVSGVKFYPKCLLGQRVRELRVFFTKRKGHICLKRDWKSQIGVCFFLFFLGWSLNSA